MQFVPLIVYFVTQQLVQSEASKFLPAGVRSWLPMIVAGIAFFVTQKLQSKSASAACGNIIGKQAPDFDITLDGKSTSLHQIVKDSPLPTLVDLYRNF